MTTETVTCRAVNWADYQTVLRSIRLEVFVEEQQVPVEEEWDGQDEDALHFLAFRKAENEMPIATARLLSTGQVGRMAVKKEFRKRGVGAQLLKLVIDTARSNGMKELFLHAQIDARPFYEGAGFTAYGEEYWEAGIRHQSMKLELRP